MGDRDRPPTSDRLRIEIDRGFTGDKVAARDPAAAPLGTDDEAGGFPPTPEQRALAAAQENRAPLAKAETRAFAGRTALIALFTLAAIATLLLLAAR